MVMFSEFVRQHYQTIILLAVAAGLFLGAWTTVPGKIIQTYSQKNLPIAMGMVLAGFPV